MAESKIEGKYELEEMSGALSAGHTDTLPSHKSSVGPDDHALVGPSDGDPVRKPQGAPREPLMRTSESDYHVPRHLPRSSLEDLLQAGEGPDFPSSNFSKDARHVPLHQPPSNDDSSAHPSLISLPPSSSTLSSQGESESPALTSRRLFKLYKARTTHLSNQFPHLKCVCSASRHDKANITLIDYSGSALQGSKQLRIDFGVNFGLRQNQKSEERRQARTEESRIFMCANSLWPDVDTRLIILEDIGPTMINLLGATFELSPEFFEEHLHRSGYRGNDLQELSPSAWRTSSLQKNYVSMEWRRPVKRWTQEPITPAQWEDLLGYFRPHHQPYGPPHLEGTERLEQIGDDVGGPKEAEYRLETTTNIFRPEFAMNMDPDGALPETTPSGWEERATACVVELNNLQYVILLLDPLPLLKKTIKGSSRIMRELETLDEHNLREQWNSNCKSQGKLIEEPGGTSSLIEIRSPFTQMYARIPWNLDYHWLFSQRTKQATAQELHDELPPFQSTKQALQRWILYAPVHEVKKYRNRLGPASMIFRIAHQDTLDFLRLIRLALADIELASSDSVLQERALHWRYRLDQFRAQLIVVEESLQACVKFVKIDETSKRKQHQPDIETSPIDYLLFNILDEINLHKRRITQAYTSLTSKVQISDSHRSIAEAETVTRLTELAFLFIPLSFATSIFGMQIVDGSTPASTYIAVAAALTSAAYLLRFFIHRTIERRSNMERYIKNKITAYAGLRSGSRIPTVTFFRWLAHVFGESLEVFQALNYLGVIILITVVIPFPIIWTSSLGRGLQILVSCLLLAVPVCLAVFSLVAEHMPSFGRPVRRVNEEP